MLVLLREKFWVPKARQAIKTILSCCMLCKKVTKACSQSPPPPPLPFERVNLTHPFNTVGVDYTGAINVVDPVSNKVHRVFICLFTCTSTRAVHLELTENMTSADFLLAFRRFCAHHSVPALLISDNGRNFHGFNRFLKEIASEPEVREYLNNKRIAWRFITPRAPWVGGFYERMIGVLKGTMAKALYKKRVTFEELRTLLCEFTCLINNRPLTFVSEERDCEPLTPAKLLYGRNLCLAPPLNSIVDETFPPPDNRELRDQYCRLSQVIKKFQIAWKQDYLTSLRERHYNSARVHDRQFQVGDIVLVDLENNSRSLWPMGKVVQTLPSSDQQVRSVKIKIGNHHYIRSVRKLVDLEVSNEILEAGPPTNPSEDVIPPASTSDAPSPSLSSDTVARPQRRAAVECARRREELIHQDLL